MVQTIFAAASAPQLTFILNCFGCIMILLDLRHEASLQSERGRQRRGRSSISKSFFFANRVVGAVVSSQIEPVRAPRSDQGRQIEPARAPRAARSSQSKPD